MDTLVCYRREVPAIYNSLLRKELDILQKNLVSFLEFSETFSRISHKKPFFSQREIECKTDIQTVNYKDAKKSYINTNLSQNVQIKPNEKVIIVQFG